MKCGNKTHKMKKGGASKRDMKDDEMMGKKKYAKGGKVRGTGCATKGTKFSGAY